MNLQAILHRFAQELDRASMTRDQPIRDTFRALSQVAREFAEHVETTGDLESADRAARSRITRVDVVEGDD